MRSSDKTETELFQTLEEFGKKLQKNQGSPDEFEQVFNDNFWDLLA